MKHNITPEQLNELTDTARNELREWWKPQPGDKTNGTGHDGPAFIGEYYYDSGYSVDDDKDVLPLLSIGQMIEFLDDNKDKFRHGMEEYYFDPRVNTRDFGGTGKGDAMAVSHPVLIDWDGELCDALWEACKEVLESKE